jgi:hypothetical protein
MPVGKGTRMEDMNVRIQRITEDLRAIQQELNFAAMQAPDDPEQSELVGEFSNLNALENLKSAIDQMRHFLWFYFQVLNNESDVRERMRQALPSSKDNNSDPNDELNFLTQKAFLRYRLNGKKPN